MGIELQLIGQFFYLLWISFVKIWCLLFIFSFFILKFDDIPTSRIFFNGLWVGTRHAMRNISTVLHLVGGVTRRTRRGAFAASYMGPRGDSKARGFPPAAVTGGQWPSDAVRIPSQGALSNPLWVVLCFPKFVPAGCDWVRRRVPVVVVVVVVLAAGLFKASMLILPPKLIFQRFWGMPKTDGNLIIPFVIICVNNLWGGRQTFHPRPRAAHQHLFKVNLKFFFFSHAKFSTKKRNNNFYFTASISCPFFILSEGEVIMGYSFGIWRLLNWII